MKVLKKVFSIIFVFFISVSLSFSQNGLVSGKVTFLDSIPIISALIIINSTKQELRSDSIGNFAVNCNFPEKIKVKANGFISETLKIEDGDMAVIVNLNLKSNKNAMKAATDNGHLKDIVKLQAMVSVQEENDFTNYKNVFDIIVASSSGVIQRGNDIIIRGKRSYGSDAALIILDDIPIESAQLYGISTTTIQSVKVLKGSYAATYGVRGANGVVEIRTKRGGNK